MSLLLGYSWLSEVLDMTQMAQDVQKNWQPAQFIILDNFCLNNFSKKSIPGTVLAPDLLMAVFGLGHDTDGTGCLEKNWKPAQFIILDNFCFNNFSKKKSITRDVLAVGLLLAVSGPGHDPDGPGCPEKLKTCPVYYP